MSKVESWLADLEAKAQEAEQGEWKAITKEFFGDVSSEVEASGGTVAFFVKCPHCCMSGPIHDITVLAEAVWNNLPRAPHITPNDANCFTHREDV